MSIDLESIKNQTKFGDNFKLKRSYLSRPFVCRVNTYIDKTKLLNGVNITHGKYVLAVEPSESEPFRSNIFVEPQRRSIFSLALSNSQKNSCQRE